MEADRFERLTAHVGPARAGALFISGGPLPDGSAAILASDLTAPVDFTKDSAAPSIEI